MSVDLDTKTIYEIFRACRLCGAGGGYKMPIIPSVVGFDCPDIELREKIRECVQIEVTQEDKMPPLICEFCVDKVNDFYEFLEMCRETNKNTRLRLGLPPQMMPQGIPDAGDCILGVTEQITFSTPVEEVPAPRLVRVKQESRKDKRKENDKRVKGLRRELESLINNDSPSSTSSSGRQPRRARSPSPSPSPPPPPTRGARGRRDASLSSNESKPSSRARSPSDYLPLSRHKSVDQPKAKPILRKTKESKVLELSDEESLFDSLLEPKTKRHRDKAPREIPEIVPKKIKISIKPTQRSPSPEKPPEKAKPGPKSRKVASKLIPVPMKEDPPLPACNICGQTFKGNQGLSSHRTKTHVVTFTVPELACNSCGAWFESGQQASEHHLNEHKLGNKMYRCRGCKGRFQKHANYVEHMASLKCAPYTEKPDIECPLCRRGFPTQTLFHAHKSKCQPVVKCTRCNKTYQTTQSFRKHEAGCREKHAKATEVKIDPGVKKRLMTAQIRMVKVDRLLKRNVKKRYNVSEVAAGFDLDKKSVYPYRSIVKVKQEPLDFDKMVSINRDIQQEFYREEDYVHWDSDLSSDSEDEYSLVNPTVKIKKVPSLTTLSLKTIYSRRCLGKVPRKLRKVKDKFDAFNDFEPTDFNINSLIDNLNDDAGNDSSKVNDNDFDSLVNDKVNEALGFVVKESAEFNDVKNSGTNDWANGDGEETDASFETKDDRNKNCDDDETTSDLSRDLLLKESVLIKENEKNNGVDNRVNENSVNDITQDSNVNDSNNVNEELNEMVNNVIKEINEIGTTVTDVINGTSQNNDYIDERQLLADLDAEIGEQNNEDSGKEKGDIVLEDLVPNSGGASKINDMEDDFTIDTDIV